LGGGLVKCINKQLRDTVYKSIDRRGNINSYAH